MQSIPRFRNRIGFDVPLQKGDRRWTPRTFYSLTDFEPIWRLDDKYLEKIRLRAGAGYIINKIWRSSSFITPSGRGPKVSPRNMSVTCGVSILRS
jgi:hypothetical protein